MEQNVDIRRKQRINIPLGFLKKDLVFTFSFILAVASCFVQMPKLEYINFHVMVSLFNLMIAIKALEELKVLDKFAITILNKSHNSRTVSSILIALCFVSSMFVTNDVALLTFVPLTVIISQKTGMPVSETIVLQTIAANIGSSLTPMGNPQNLFLFSHYDIKPFDFFAAVLVVAAVGIGLLFIFTMRLPKKQLKVELPSIPIANRYEAWIWGMVLAVIIASIFGFISQTISFLITVMAAVILNRNLLVKIDYLLLITFISFFVFIGNISNTEAIQTIANTGFQDSTSVFFSSIILSQFVSNVPAAILLANFTADWQPLLLGVNIGGLGTIIASLASVISYKIFIQAKPLESKKYLLTFSMYNIAFLIILAFFQYVIFLII
ncbi:SLC13 family permease [Niallia endozanthoxylica]|uniref:Anion transporter n=1 Tax=Niallia endozanthoxylica TaxID=2036016 RepID=A0A5J5HUF6_9BACI|nr:SLC13 family permease [Niallia endozanthoxylica]KAA9023935.1 anion transporter [Niallia endozanthoxylica]